MRNQFKQIIKHDFTIGISQNVAKYLISIFLCTFFCMLFYNGVASIGLTNGSFMDCSIFLFKGMNVYIPSSQTPFRIPIIWMLIQVMIALLIVPYPTEDLHAYGLQVMTRVKNRSNWWISKCIWNITTVILCYLTLYLVILIFTLIFGKLSFFPDQSINLVINKVELKNPDLKMVSVAVFLLPMLTSISLSQLQMTLSFILSPVYSFIIIICILIASAYFFNPVLIGNFSMVLRNELVYTKGLSNTTAIIINVSVWAASNLLGYCYLKKCDLLKKG